MASPGAQNVGRMPGTGMEENIVEKQVQQVQQEAKRRYEQMQSLSMNQGQQGISLIFLESMYSY